MQWKLFPLKPPGLVLHGATNHHECKLLHIYTLPQQHMRDNCTRLQIAPVLSCSRAKSAPGCSIHLNPSEQLQKLPPAVTPITMSTCTTFICSFFSFWKRWPVWAAMLTNIVGVFVFYQLQIQSYNIHADKHCAPPVFSSFFLSILFSFREVWWDR